MTPIPTLRVIQWQGSVPGRVLAAALDRDQALFATADELLTVRLLGIRATVIRALPLQSMTIDVALSPSGDFASVTDSSQLYVWGQHRDTPVVERKAHQPRTGIVGAFARLGDREVLICDPRKGELEAVELRNGERTFAGSTQTFRVGRFITSGTATHVAALGYFAGESKDSLAVVPIVELASSGDVLHTRFAKKLPVADYAHRLAAGPCGNDAFVFFRDPEHDEDPDEESPSDVSSDTSGTALSTADLLRHRGFYVRALDGSLRAKQPWDGPIKSGGRLAATTTWIAADCTDRVALVPIGTEPPTSIDARWIAASSDGSRILVDNANAELSIIDLRV